MSSLTVPQQTPTGLPLPGRPAPASAPPPGDPGRRWRWVGRAARRIADLWLLLLLLLLWEVVARADPTLFFPPLSAVLSRSVELFLVAEPGQLLLSDLLWSNASASLSRFLRGWGAAIVLGVAFGVLLGRVRLANRMYGPIVRFFMSLPKVALLPIAVQIFGVTDSMNIFLIFIGTIWIITINTCDGIRNVDEAWLRSARSLRLRRIDLYRRVLLPAASPQILAGIRVSLGTALILMVVSELYATTSGVGYQIVYTERTFSYVDMWAWFLVVGVIGIILNRLFVFVEARLLRWERRAGLGEL
ncbi:ABC transporter permease [Micromonospora sp. NPDC049900]|uniref:ABC transporter permease n=1 Tax=unclassified Micromonospora TaxID=2617518 RepID=UPI0037A07440